MTATYTISLVTETCCSCGVAFGVPDDWQRERRRDRKSFYCPNGHCQHYVAKSDEELRREAEAKLASERAAHDQTRAALRTKEQAALRLKKRLKAGVCPCCKRTFSCLARHMTTKHPEYAA